MICDNFVYFTIAIVPIVRVYATIIFHCNFEMDHDVDVYLEANIASCSHP